MRTACAFSCFYEFSNTTNILTLFSISIFLFVSRYAMYCCLYFNMLLPSLLLVKYTVYIYEKKKKHNEYEEEQNKTQTTVQNR